jgi:hypothetical protein
MTDNDTVGVLAIRRDLRAIGWAIAETRDLLVLWADRIRHPGAPGGGE